MRVGGKSERNDLSETVNFNLFCDVCDSRLNDENNNNNDNKGEKRGQISRRKKEITYLIVSSYASVCLLAIRNAS